MLIWTSEKPDLLLSWDLQQVFVSLCLTVGGNWYWIFGSGTKLVVSGETNLSFLCLKSLLVSFQGEIWTICQMFVQFGLIFCSFSSVKNWKSKIQWDTFLFNLYLYLNVYKTKTMLNEFNVSLCLKYAIKYINNNVN